MATTEAKAAAAAKKKAAQEAAAAAKIKAKEELAAKVKTVNLAQSDADIAKDLGITEADLGGYTLGQKLIRVTGSSESNYQTKKVQAALAQGAKLGPEYLDQSYSDGESFGRYTQDFVFPDGRKVQMQDLGINRVVPRGNGSYQLAMTAPGGGDLLFDVNPNKTTGKLAINPKTVLIDTGESSGIGGFIDTYAMPAALAYMTAGLGAEIGAVTGTGAAGGNALLAGGMSAAQGNDLEQVLTNAAIGGAAGAYSDSAITVGGVTGPDNIDVGGGFNPATGATAAELEAARLALETPNATGLESLPSSVNTVEQAFGTGGGDIATDAANAAGASGTNVTVDDITKTITGNADKAALYGNEGYGETLTKDQIDAVDKAVSGGMTFKDAVDMVRAGLLVNALTGDPLGLGGDKPSDQPGPGTGGTSGFARVPVPAEWKSPTYAPIAAPIDLSTIFSNENMLGGTQWQNLPMQRNVTFNDIFAAGQQQTPMGSPVDINQIVSSILGQAATSQKSA